MGRCALCIDLYPYLICIERLIDTVKTYPCLCDLKADASKDSKYKNELWDNITEGFRPDVTGAYMYCETFAIPKVIVRALKLECAVILNETPFTAHVANCLLLPLSTRQSVTSIHDCKKIRT